MTPSFGVLSDRSIRWAISAGIIRIEPFTDAHVQPASYDLTLDVGTPLRLEVGEFHLLTTRETVALPRHVQGSIHGRSSIGRLGVLVHFTAGFVDPGFHGQLTLEVMALHKPVELWPGDRIAQLAFTWLDQPCEHPYLGRYDGQTGPTESRFAHGDG